MASGKRDYFSLGPILSLILAIIPFTSWLFGIITRFTEGKIIAGIIRIFLGWIIWILDLVFMILTGHIFKFLNM